MGEIVQDTMTPYKGAVIGILKYLHSTTQYYVQSESLESGKPVGLWIDGNRLESVTPRGVA